MYKIFFQNITCLDHGFVDQDGLLKGGSFHVNVEVSSSVLDEDDFTVIDFSSGKKKIKALIDSMETGYDHKTWIIPNWSKISGFTGTYLVTNSFSMIAPATAFRVFDFVNTYQDINIELQNYLKLHLPEFDFVVTCKENVFSIEENYSKFRYVHGLYTSTKSLGCQNIGHGHLSYVTVKDDNLLTEKIANDLNNAIFIFEENIKDVSELDLTLNYTTEARGEFTLKLRKNCYNMIFMSVETTIENISHYVSTKYNIPKGNLIISEGLSKGAIV